MHAIKSHLPMAVALLLVPCISLAINFNPQDIETELYTGQHESHDITITNDGNAVLNWQARIEILGEPQGNRREARQGVHAGPRRDAAGDLLATIQGPYATTSGLAFDGQWLWGISYNDNRLWAVDPANGQTQVDVQLGQNPIEIGFNPFDGLIYVDRQWGGNTIVRVDRNGQQLNQFDLPFAGIAGIAFDDNGLLWVNHRDAGQLQQFDANNNQILRAVNYHDAVQGQDCFCMDYVPAHTNGHFWLEAAGRVFQINVPDQGDNAEAVQNFATQNQVQHDGLAHDGYDLWVGQWNTHDLYRYDDGIIERYWIAVNPRRGAIQAQDQQVMTATLNAYGLIAGDWTASIHLLSNDQNNPDVEISVTMTVDAASDISATWDRAVGYPNLMDWNAAYRDLFTGHPYDLIVHVANVGSDDLSVNEIDFDDNVFSSPQEQGFVVGAGQSSDVTVTFNSGQSGMHQATMTMQTNDPDMQQLHIPLSANAAAPPVIGYDPQALEQDLNTGDQVVRQVTISNDGESDLRWQLQTVFTGAPGQRDQNKRQLRSVKEGLGPVRRDNAGDVLQRVNAPHTGITGLAWDAAHHLMWGDGYDQQRIWAMDLSTGQTMADFNIGFYGMGLAYDPVQDQLIVSDLNAANIRVFDTQGDLIRSTQYPAGAYVMGNTYNPQSDHFWSLDLQRRVLLEWNRDWELLRTVDYSQAIAPHGGEGGIVWVPAHQNGHLWVSTIQRLYQLDIPDGANQAQAVSSFGDDIQEWHHGLTHDGHNLWVGGQWGTAQMEEVDDGYTEWYWLAASLTKGTIAGGGEQDIDVTLDAAGLIGGQYTADMHFTSNDPNNGEVVVAVTINVTGIPDIRVQWAANVGFPDDLNFDPAFIDLFTGYSFHLPVTVYNDGTAPLVVNDVGSDNNEFSVDSTQFTLQHNDSLVLTVTFLPVQDGFHEAQISIQSNDPDHGEWDIHAEGNSAAPPVIHIDPQAFQDDLQTGQQSQHQLTLGNQGGADMRWSGAIQFTGDPGHRDQNKRQLRSVKEALGPARRDNAGDVIQRINAPHVSVTGLAWDANHQWMWGDGYDQQRIWAMDLTNGQTMADFGIGFYGMGLAYDPVQDQLIVSDLNAANIRVFDLQGNLVHSTQYPAGAYVMGNTYDPQSDHFWSLDLQRRVLLEWSRDWQLLRTVDYSQAIQPHGGEGGIVWVPAHQDGHLWVSTIQRLYQLNIPDDGNQAQVVSSFADDIQEWHHGLTHDGHNLWVGGQWETAQIEEIDDGLVEWYWLDFDPKRGTLAGGDDLEISVTVNAARLLGGHYSADLNISSNDPNTPLATVSVDLDVTGIPDIVVGWDQNVGFPDVMNFNRRYTDLFTGYPYDLTFIVANDGTARLDIGDITSDLNEFTADPTQFNLAPGDTQVVTLSFTGGEDGDHQGNITIHSNDPDSAEFRFPATATALTAPVFQIQPNQITERMDAGQTANDHETIHNGGVADMRWQEETEFHDPQRDNGGRRTLRSVNGASRAVAPERDNAGDVINRINGPYTGVTGLAWDANHQWMWGDGFDQQHIWAMDLTNGHTMADFNIGFYGMGLAYDPVQNQLVVSDLNAAFVRVFDLQGNLVNSTHYPAGAYIMGNTYDPHSDHFWSLDLQRRVLLEWSRDWQLLRTVDYSQAIQPHGGEGGIVWVPAHQSGHLWVSTIQRLYQLNIPGGANQAQAVSSFADDIQEWHHGLTHDGHDLWVGGQWGTAQMEQIDDGITEWYWLAVDPTDGTVGGNQDQALSLTLDATGLQDASYSADLHFTSNDPENPNVVTTVSLTVGSGLHHFTGVVRTADSNSLLITAATNQDQAVPTGWEVGVLTPGGVLAGAGLWTDGDSLGLSVWGDDPQTDPIEGFRTGEMMSFKLWDNQANQEYQAVAMVDSGGGNIHPLTHGWSANGFDELSLVGVGVHNLEVTGAALDNNPIPSGWEIEVLTPDGLVAGDGIWVDGDTLSVRALGDDPNTNPVEGFRQGDAFAFRYWDIQDNREYAATASFSSGPEAWQADGNSALSLAATSAYTCNVQISAGWNTISINVTPPQEMWNDNGPDVRRMMAQFRDGNQMHVQLMKDENGNFYAPAIGDFCNIPFWNLQEGYQVKMDRDVAGAWTGEQIAAGADVPISAGWNLIAYYPTYQLDASSASHFYVVSPILDHVIIAKNASGQFMVPRIPFSNMVPWMEGQGYQINVNADVVLNYPAQQDRADALPVEPTGQVGNLSYHWATPVSTGSNMSVLVTDFSGIKVSNGDQVAAFSPSGALVGAGNVSDGKCGLAVWGDDKTTDAVDGLIEGEGFTLKLWNVEKAVEVGLRASVSYGSGLVYKTDDLVALRASAESAIPDHFYLSQNYPNPFNSTTRIEFGLPQASPVSIRVYDSDGRLAATLFSGQLPAGSHTAIWNAEAASAGVYLVKMETGLSANGFSSVKKLMLVK